MTTEEAQAPPKPQIFGPYVLAKALGRGAMGDVHLARPVHPDRGIPTPIVVKRLHGELAGRKGFVARFKHEAAIAVAVESAHVAKVYDVGCVGETLYICMEYVPGWPLSKVLDAILKSGHHASIASVVDLIAGGLEGLHALHTAIDPESGSALEIVHRDLSPKNLMVGEDGMMRLIDLGLGKSTAQGWRTRTGVVMGSVGYMPPEQALGERVDARADVYAMGVVAFEMLALRNYIRRGPLPKMMDLSKSPSFVRPSEFRPDVPRGLDHVIERALRPDKTKRYQSAKEFLTELRRVVPPTHAQGGMRALLEDLFGSTREQREDEIRMLMGVQLADEFDGRPTRVYVMRDGILPPDMQPTQHRVSPHRKETVDVSPVTVRDGTAATEVSSLEPAGPTAASPTVPLVMDPTSSKPSGRSSSVAAVVPVTNFSTPAPTGGISIGVLIASVVAAALVGGLVATLVIWNVEANDRNAVQAVLPPKAPPPKPTAAVEPRPFAARDPEVESSTPDVPPEPPPERTATRKRTKKRAPAKAKPAPPVKTAPPPADTVASIDRKLTRLSEQLQKKRAGANEATLGTIRLIQRDITFARRNNNLVEKRTAYEKLVVRARALP